MLSQSEFVHKGITHVSISETDDEGNAVCSGCKKPIVMNKAYVQMIWDDETNTRSFSVHKYCSVQK